MPRLARIARREAPFLTVLALLALAAGYVGLYPDHWLRSSALISAALLLGALLRAVLPSSRAGLLAVRRKWWDVFGYALLGFLIAGTGLVLPG